MQHLPPDPGLYDTMASRWDLERDRHSLLEECKTSGLDTTAFTSVYPERDTNLVNRYTGLLILQLGAVMAPLILDFCKSAGSMSEGDFLAWLALMEKCTGFWGYYNVFWRPWLCHKLAEENCPQCDNYCKIGKRRIRCCATILELIRRGTFRLFPPSLAGESFCPVGCHDAIFTCWEAEWLHMCQCHPQEVEHAPHIPAKPSWLRDQLLFVNPDLYMQNRLAGYALLTAVYQKARREPNAMEMDPFLLDFDFDFQYHFLDAEYAPLLEQESMADGVIGSLARHGWSVSCPSRKVVRNAGYAWHSVYLDHAAQIGLLTTNKDLWLYDSCHIGIAVMATASKLAREKVGKWAHLVPKYGGLVQGDDTYNFCFYGVGAPLTIYGRSDQLMTHALFLQGLQGAC